MFHVSRFTFYDLASRPIAAVRLAFRASILPVRPAPAVVDAVGGGGDVAASFVVDPADVDARGVRDPFAPAVGADAERRERADVGAVGVGAAAGGGHVPVYVRVLRQLLVDA